MAIKKKTKAIILAAVCLLIIAAIALSAVLIYRSTPQFALNEAGKYIDMGDYKSAIIALEEALIKFPDNADIRLALSEAYELGGDIENAFNVLDDYIDRDNTPESRRLEIEMRIEDLYEQMSQNADITQPNANEQDEYTMSENINNDEGENAISLSDVSITETEEMHSVIEDENELQDIYTFDMLWRTIPEIEQEYGIKLIESNNSDSFYDADSGQVYVVDNSSYMIIMYADNENVLRCGGVIVVGKGSVDDNIRCGMTYNEIKSAITMGELYEPEYEEAHNVVIAHFITYDGMGFAIWNTNDVDSVKNTPCSEIRIHGFG